MRLKWWLGAVAAIAVAGGALFWLARDEATGQAWRTVAVARGPIVNEVSSTGTLNAVVTVQVGSQVSGQIAELLADFNSPVRAGDVIARIDPETFAARVAQARAELGVAEAALKANEADIARARAEQANARFAVAEARRDLDRKEDLFRTRVASASQVDSARAAFDQTSALLASRTAQVAMAEAQQATARAQVVLRQAQVRTAEVDLDRTVIRSPVDGVIIERNVDVGQTVAASLQAPTLFTIARDLRDMQVETSMDEADIGRIVEGQPVRFTVDAFPGREFEGSVQQIRKAPKNVQNVVTYTVVVSAANPDLRLLPGMTANVRVIIDERTDALRLPNAALRFRPPGAAAPATAGGDPGAADGGPPGRPDPEAMLARLTESLKLDAPQQAAVRAIFAEGREKIAGLRAQGVPPEQIREQAQALRQANQARIAAVLRPDQATLMRQLQARREASPVRRATVWVVGDDGAPTAREITVGLADANTTEVLRGLDEGASVIVGAALSAEAGATAGSSQRRPAPLGL